MTRTSIPFSLPAAAWASIAVLSLGGCTVYGPSPEHPVGDGEYTALPRKDGIRQDREVTVPPIPLLSAQRYVYRLTNLPPEQCHVTLTLDDPSDAKVDAIDAAGVRVKVSVINQATGAIITKEGRLLGDWGTTLESWSGTPVVYDAMWFRASRREVYDVIIEVTPARPSDDPNVTATLRLRNDPR